MNRHCEQNSHVAPIRAVALESTGISANPTRFDGKYGRGHTMLTQIGRSSGPSTYYQCSCGQKFEADMMSEKNVVQVMRKVAADNRGGTKMAPVFEPQCPKCGK